MGFDIDGAYLQTPRDKDDICFVRVPKSFQDSTYEKLAKEGKDPLLGLNTYVYGEKRAGDKWATYFGERLESQGWVKLACTQMTIFTRENCTLGVYVDDGAAEGQRVVLTRIIWELKDVVTLDDPRILETMLGLHFQRLMLSGARAMTVHQSSYAALILRNFVEENGGPPRRADTPTLEVEEKLELIKPGKFANTCRRHIGGAMFLMRGSRPDIAFATNSLAREVTRWSEASDMRLSRLFGYISTTESFGLLWVFPEDAGPGDLRVRCRSDADHGGSKTDNVVQDFKSTSGWVVYLATEDWRGRMLVDWNSRKQGATSLSSTEAEVTAVNDAYVKSSTPVLDFFDEVHDAAIPYDHDTDNDAGRAILLNLRATTIQYISRHQGVHLGFLRDVFNPRRHPQHNLSRVDTKMNESDIFTKSMKTSDIFKGHRTTMGALDVTLYKNFAVIEAPIEGPPRGKVMMAIDLARNCAAFVGPFVQNTAQRLADDEGLRSAVFRYLRRRAMGA
jgi:hypothetical protein